ncbi:TMEM104 [Cordylochernes scorpioides]|uniref:TMEM104 n=1 Tax=Cordylochernes scorpioides TaxID=51811 RepID=A0ABY6LIB4_9ARAC|nr:TMEM104 [Cordylochernes scorpioides]
MKTSLTLCWWGNTGSYAGAGVQYVIPALLVYRARKDSLQLLGLGVHNKHASPFWHNGWIVFVLIWTVICIVLVTIHHIYTGRKLIHRRNGRFSRQNKRQNLTPSIDRRRN